MTVEFFLSFFIMNFWQNLKIAKLLDFCIGKKFRNFHNFFLKNSEISSGKRKKITMPVGYDKHWM